MANPKIVNGDDLIDDRPFIDDLLKEHSLGIQSILKIIKADSLYHKGNNSSLYDEVWVLRFLLSHKKVKNAAKAALKTMHFRDEKGLNEFGDIRYMMHTLTGPKTNLFPIFHKYNSCFSHTDAVVHTLPDENRGGLSIISVKKANMTKLFDLMSVEDMCDVFMYISECLYQVLDDVTRRTGRLTKHLRVIDFHDISLKEIDIRGVKKNAAGNKLIEDYYPQLLGGVVLMNCPSWFSSIWNLVRHLFPKRIVEKTQIIGPKLMPRDLKFLMRFVSVENLPVKLGGSNKKWPNVDDIAATFRYKKNVVQSCQGARSFIPQYSHVE